MLEFCEVFVKLGFGTKYDSFGFEHKNQIKRVYRQVILCYLVRACQRISYPAQELHDTEMLNWILRSTPDLQHPLELKAKSCLSG